jgi:hypothetical protein
MSAPMVSATLEDRKTNTRRMNGLDDSNANPGQWELVGT